MKIIATLPVLFVVTYRPEFEPTWISQPHVTTLTITRLARREVDIMIDNLAADSASRAAGIRTEKDISVDRSDGVPLFVEEVTKAVLGGWQPDWTRVRSLMSHPRVSKSLPRCRPRSWLASIGWARLRK